MPEPIARVNGQPISVRQVLPMAKKELDQGPPGEVEQRQPAALRRALRQYVDRELLLQEALARGVAADSRQVDWAYDQMRRDHADEARWAQFLAELGLDPQSLRAELRAHHTVAALLEQELREVTGGEPEEEASPERRAEVQEALLARLRAKARIELLL